MSLVFIACCVIPTKLSAQDVGGVILPRDSASSYPYSELSSSGCLWLSAGYGNVVGTFPDPWQYGAVYEKGKHFNITGGLELQLVDRFVGLFEAGYASSTYDGGDGSPLPTFVVEAMMLGAAIGVVSSFTDPIAIEGAVGLTYFSTEPGHDVHPRVDGALRIQPRGTDVLMRLGVSYMNDAVMLRLSLGLKL
jgi:hypothetical protein